MAELKNNQFRVEREKLIRIWYGPFIVGRHRLDLVVEDQVILELKASRKRNDEFSQAAKDISERRN